MINNITSYNGIDTSSYTTANDTKKLDSKNDITSNNKNSQGITQNLSTDTFVKSIDESTINSTYKPVKKKLTTEEVNALKEEQEKSKADLIKRFINDTINNQNKLLGRSTENGTSELSKESSDLLTKIFGSLENAYPPIATTPEGAQQAISEGGAYSVNAVADRIMTMATAIAGNDPDKLQQMRDAVQKGFEEAGSAFKDATKSDLPQICKDTYTEVMSRFDKLQNKTSDTNQEIKS